MSDKEVPNTDSDGQSMVISLQMQTRTSQSMTATSEDWEKPESIVNHVTRASKSMGVVNGPAIRTVNRPISALANLTLICYGLGCGQAKIKLTNHSRYLCS